MSAGNRLSSLYFLFAPASSAQTRKHSEQALLSRRQQDAVWWDSMSIQMQMSHRLYEDEGRLCDHMTSC